MVRLWKSESITRSPNRDARIDLGLVVALLVIATLVVDVLMGDSIVFPVG